MTNSGNRGSLMEYGGRVRNNVLYGNGSKSSHQWSKCSLFVVILGSMSLLSMSLVEAQTFQYSRGWTNGKRSGGGVNYGPSGNVAPYDLESAGGGGILLGDPNTELILPPGHLQMSLSPQSRFRGGEYSQYLVKRSAVLGKREPMWIGTIVGMDGDGVTGAGEGQGQPRSSSSTPNANPGTVNVKRHASSSPSDF